MTKTILVTGGAGYIGSHACVALLESGFDVLVLDNLCNSNIEALERIERIAGKRPQFLEGDVRDAKFLDQVFDKYPVTAVMHFAGLKAVGESVAQPGEYYQNNVAGTLVLLQAMKQSMVRNLVFSSSATVYGDPASAPIRETAPLSANNPYGRSKLMVEQILADWFAAHPDWSIARLRYFNPIGAHPSGLIGEDPNGVPNNLMPFIAQVAVGRQERLYVFGDDYPTRDGTGIRDYIHVMDLVEGHIAALAKLLVRPDLLTVNLGTGRGVSVLELIGAFEKCSGKTIPYEISPRRAGDIAQCWANVELAAAELGWRATRTVDQMCADSWRWQSKNPQGYR